jgi:hypothetical protein
VFSRDQLSEYRVLTHPLAHVYPTAPRKTLSHYILLYIFITQRHRNLNNKQTCHHHITHKKKLEKKEKQTIENHLVVFRLFSFLFYTLIDFFFSNSIKNKVTWNGKHNGKFLKNNGSYGGFL